MTLSRFRFPAENSLPTSILQGFMCAWSCNEFVSIFARKELGNGKGFGIDYIVCFRWSNVKGRYMIKIV